MVDGGKPLSKNARLTRYFLVFMALMLLVPALAQGIRSQPQGLPTFGPDVPTTDTPLTPATVVEVFVDEHYVWSAGARAKTFEVPTPSDGAWDRIMLEYSSRPVGDPWDRMFGVSFGDVEVIRGTTPRAAFALEKDVTAFASLLPPGENATVKMTLSSWDGGGLLASVTLRFYDQEATAALVEPAFAEAHGVWLWAGLHGHGHLRAKPMEFANATPTRAMVEVTLSGHSGEEFWWQQCVAVCYPRTFTIGVDGTTIGTVQTIPPYVYAFLGFYGTPGALHGPMWWTAQQALDIAGVHTGVGEIPAYRFEVEPEHLPLLTGDANVTIQQRLGGSVWTTSVSFLLDR